LNKEYAEESRQRILENKKEHTKII
jgi:hypothetical protein